MRPEDLTIQHVEQASKTMSRLWHGNCYGIACAIVESELVDGVAVYGHYLGEVNPNGYWGNRDHHPFIQHGWVQLDDGRILDPTRWSFENEGPYLALIGPDDPKFEDYDEGGNSWREAMRMPCPSTTTKPKVALDVRSETRQYIEQQLPEGMAFEDITMDQVFWLANTPYQQLGNLAGDLYQAICKADAREFIPLDNRRLAERQFGLVLG